MKRSKLKNPFYPCLVIVGILFTITAIAYGFMAVGALRGAFPVASAEVAQRGENQLEAGEAGRHTLLLWLEQYGERAMLWELALLGVFTGAAIGTDSWWDEQRE